MIGHRAIGQNLAFQIFHQRAEIADRLGAPAQSWEALRRRREY